MLLCDWMVTLQESFEIENLVLHKAFSYVDIYLNKTRNIKKEKLQLLGATCIFISSKIESQYPITIAQMVEYCNFKYRVYEFLAFEHDLVSTIDYILNIPTSFEYIEAWICVISKKEK